MASIQVHATRAFARAFRACLADGPVAITIVSPFLTPVAPWESTLAFARFVIARGAEKVEIVTQPPLPDHALDRNKITLAEAELIEAEGVLLKIRDTDLHSKVYVMRYADPERTVAFIGSSNFTQGGFERNDETMVQIGHPDDMPVVEREVSRLTTYGSFPFYAWKATKLGKKS
jgi:phosphatidylserine/phosphatidylglycerophosphate/cardiolipin synthase-like enzyme